MRVREHPALVPLALVALALASVSVATFLEGKRLWAAYNLIGAALALGVLVLLAKLDLELPRGASIVCLVTAMLHYVGGSLGGHYGVGGINGLYAVFPWWDRVTHFAGAAGVALLVYHALRAARAARGWIVPDGALAFFAFATAVCVGVGVELFEFGAWSFFGTIDQGFYSNTMMDLYDDATGAAFGAALANALAAARAGRSVPASRARA